MHFTITEARNPQWVDSNHNKIDLEVNFFVLKKIFCDKLHMLRARSSAG